MLEEESGERKSYSLLTVTRSTEAAEPEQFLSNSSGLELTPMPPQSPSVLAERLLPHGQQQSVLKHCTSLHLSVATVSGNMLQGKLWYQDKVQLRRQSISQVSEPEPFTHECTAQRLRRTLFEPARRKLAPR